MGDTLIVEHSPGLIRARKLDPQKLGFERVRPVTVSHITRKYTDEPIPKVRLVGDWLTDIGFEIDAVATVASEPGIMTLKLTEDGEYNALMKFVRQHKMKLTQVSKDPHKRREEPQPCIGITGSIVDKAGFQKGDMLAASYEYGTIKLQKLDFEKLGF